MFSLPQPQSTTSAMASLGAPSEPLLLASVLAKAARVQKCVAFRTPSEKGKVANFDLYYLTTEAAYQKAIAVIPKKNVPRCFSFGGPTNQFLRIKTTEEKNTYNRLHKRKEEWLRLAGPVQCEVQLVTPINELPGHISWTELAEKAELYKPAASPPPTVRRPCPKSKKPQGVVFQDDTLSPTPLITTPKSSKVSANFTKNSPMFPFTIVVAEPVAVQQPAVQQPADQEADPAWMQQRNRPASPLNGAVHVVAAEVIEHPITPPPPPARETVTVEDAPEEEDVTPPPRVPTPVPEERIPRVRIQDFNEIVLAPPSPRDPRGDPFIPAVESILDPDVGLLGRLFAEMDNLSVSILRHTDEIADGRFPVLPLPKSFQVPSMAKVASADLVNELNSIFREAAEKASRALVRAQVEAAKVINVQASSLGESRQWTEDDLETAQAIRLSRHTRQQPYKPSNKPPVIFFELVDGAIRAHGSAAVAHTTAGRKSDNAAPAQNGNIAKKKKKKNGKKKKTAPAPAPAPAAAPTAAPSAAPASAAPKRGGTGNGQQPRQTGNRGKTHRTSVFERLGPVDPGHRDRPENKKLLARARKDREDYCRRFNVPLSGFKNNEERMAVIKAMRPADYRPTISRDYAHRPTAQRASGSRQENESTFSRRNY